MGKGGLARISGSPRAPKGRELGAGAAARPSSGCGGSAQGGKGVTVTVITVWSQRQREQRFLFQSGLKPPPAGRTLKRASRAAGDQLASPWRRSARHAYGQEAGG